jgi:hypothetical protein
VRLFKFILKVGVYITITYNFVAVDFTANLCQKTYPVAVLQRAYNNKMLLIVLPTQAILFDDTVPIVYFFLNQLSKCCQVESRK